MNIIGSRKVLKMPDIIKFNSGPLPCFGPDCETGYEERKVICINSNTYHVECQNCGARGSKGKTKSQAVENWNVLIDSANSSIADEE